MVELRKRKEPPASAPAAKPALTTKKRATSSKPATSKPEADATKSDKKPAGQDTKPTPSANSAPAAGSTLALDEFKSITVQTNDEEATTLPALLEKNSDKSIAIFTYPKASTPGCTNQVCLFRDLHEELAPAFEVYGLSIDTPKSNTNFKNKQNLPYSLLCDPKRQLIGKLGFAKAGGGTTRGVVVVGKDGNVKAWMTGGPQATLDAVKDVMGKS